MEKCEFYDACVLRRVRAGGEYSHPKRKGELGELVFVLKATGLGLDVCKPYGDSSPFDFVVVSGRRLLRVQVKSAFVSERRGYIINLHGHGTRPYSIEEIDFYAGYVVAYDAWYIIPVKAIGGRSLIRLYPNGGGVSEAGKFEHYREAWHLITKQEASVSPVPSVVESDVH
jgi:hypothetical protein